MELALNLIWAFGALLLLRTTYTGVRRGSVRLPMLSAMTLTLLICFLLLPVLSMSDDLIEARQAALPASAQTWRMASENASIGLELPCLLSAALLLLVWMEFEVAAYEEGDWDTRRFSSWLTRSQRLRPPPAPAE